MVSQKHKISNSIFLDEILCTRNFNKVNIHWQWSGGQPKNLLFNWRSMESLALRTCLFTWHSWLAPLFPFLHNAILALTAMYRFAPRTNWYNSSSQSVQRLPLWHRPRHRKSIHLVPCAHYVLDMEHTRSQRKGLLKIKRWITLWTYFNRFIKWWLCW